MIASTRKLSALKTLFVHKLSKQYYRKMIENFMQKSLNLLKEQTFYEMKRILLTEVINRQILKDYLNYKNKSLRKNIFIAIKHLAFESKLI